MLKSLNLVLAFVLELSMLAAFAYFGFTATSQLPLQITLAVGLPLAVAVIWGFWLAPRASRRLQEPWLVIAKLALFGLATLALYVTGQPLPAVILGVLFLANTALLYLLH